MLAVLKISFVQQKLDRFYVRTGNTMIHHNWHNDDDNNDDKKH